MFVLKHSCPASQSELNLFNNAPTAVDVESGYHTQYQPTSSLSDGPIRFKINNDQQDYIDLLHSYLLLTLKVVKEDGSDLDDDTCVAPVNNIAQSLFSQVDVYLNGTLVTHSSNTSHYRAYLENLLSYDKGAKQSQLTLGGWFKDTTEQFDAMTTANRGFCSRKALVSKSKPLQVLSRLHTDISLQGRYILNGVDIELRLVRNPDALCLMGAADSKFRIKITEASFFVRKVKLSSNIQLKNIRKLDTENKPALYPISRTEVRSFSIASGSHSCIEEGLFTGQLPRRLIIALVESQAYEGRYNKNPFNFQHFNLNYACVYRNGIQVPSKPYTPDFKNDCFAREYLSIFQGTGRHYTDQGLDMSMKDYKAGNTILCFDFTGDLSDCGAFHMIEKGNIRLELRFGEQLPLSVNVIALAEWDSCLRISRDRTVSIDYFS